MIDGNVYRMNELYEHQDMNCIEKTILNVLNEQKVSLSQTRSIFNNILIHIEDSNPITL